MPDQRAGCLADAERPIVLTLYKTKEPLPPFPTHLPTHLPTHPHPPTRTTHTKLDTASRTQLGAKSLKSEGVSVLALATTLDLLFHLQAVVVDPQGVDVHVDSGV